MEKIKNRNFVNLNMNPCKMCMPIGAVIAFRGIEKSMTILHGSQGCSAYMRTHLTTHYAEPIDIASSSLHENATIYGGLKNLKKALQNVQQLYAPRLIGVATSCLAETIGEDIQRIVAEYKAENNTGDDIHIITSNTPSYGGTLYEGYFSTLRSIVTQATGKTALNNKVNIIMGHLSPGDVRNIKSILEAFGLDYILLPDISQTFDAPFSKEFKRVPDGGTKFSDIEQMSGARATIEIGVTVPEKLSPGKYLEETFGVPLYRVPIPIGIRNSDLFFKILSEVAQKAIPEKFLEERGRLIDGMVDAHKLNAEIKPLIYGDPDLVYAISSLCFENGIYPSLISTGSASALMKTLLGPLTANAPEKPLIVYDTDFETIEHHALERNINLIIGDSTGKHLTEKYGIPPVRVGFPIQDRYGGQRLVYTAYNGSLKLLDDISNAMLAQKFGQHRKIMYEKYYRPHAAPDSA